MHIKHHCIFCNTNENLLLINNKDVCLGCAEAHNNDADATGIKYCGDPDCALCSNGTPDDDVIPF